MAEDKKKAVIWIIDSQQWPRACFRAELMERGFDVIGFVTPAHALAAHKCHLYAEPRIIILELFGLDAKEEEIAAVRRIGIPTVVLGGALQLNKDFVRASEWAAMIQRPFTIGRVADTVENLLQ